jgi:hypothetical protein
MFTARWRWLSLAFILCLFVTLARGFERVVAAQLWAEDGPEFLRAQLELGDKALLLPYAGYFHLLPRLLTSLLSRLPIALFPSAIALATYAIWAAICASIASDRLAHLIPARSLRLLTALLVCLVPSLHEVGGNVACVHLALFVSLGLVALTDPKRELRALDLVWVFVCAATEGAAFMMAFAFVARAWAREGKLALRPNRDYYAAFILVVCAALTVFLLRDKGAGSRHHIAPGVVIETIYRVVLDRFFLTPWLSPRWLLIVGSSLALMTCASLAFMALVLFALRRRSDLRAAPLLSVIASVVGLYVVTWFVRPGAIEIFRNVDIAAAEPMHRYSFVSYPFAIVLTMTALSAFNRTWTLLFAIINAAGAATYFLSQSSTRQSGDQSLTRFRQRAQRMKWSSQEVLRAGGSLTTVAGAQ